jgi:hypothetical protein
MSVHLVIKFGRKRNVLTLASSGLMIASQLCHRPLLLGKSRKGCIWLTQPRRIELCTGMPAT